MNDESKQDSAVEACLVNNPEAGGSKLPPVKSRTFLPSETLLELQNMTPKTYFYGDCNYPICTTV